MALAQFGTVYLLPNDAADPGNMGPELTRLAIGLSAFTVVIVGLRFTSRRMMRHQWDVSDWMLLAGAILTLAINACAIWAVTMGLGQHVLRVPEQNYEPMLKMTIADVVLYVVALFLIRCSIMMLYMSIFGDKAFRWTAAVIILLCFLYTAGSIITNFLSCRPLAGIWTMGLPATCIDIPKSYLYSGIASLALDVIVLLAPIVNLIRLKLDWRSTVSVSLIFMLGGFACVASGVRLMFISNWKDMDTTWEYDGIAYWSLVELNLAVVSACLPTLRPLVLYLIKGVPFTRKSQSKEPRKPAGPFSSRLNSSNQYYTARYRIDGKGNTIVVPGSHSFSSEYGYPFDEKPPQVYVYAKELYRPNRNSVSLPRGMRSMTSTNSSEDTYTNRRNPLSHNASPSVDVDFLANGQSGHFLSPMGMTLQMERARHLYLTEHRNRWTLSRPITPQDSHIPQEYQFDAERLKELEIHENAIEVDSDEEEGVLGAQNQRWTRTLSPSTIGHGRIV